MAGTPACGSAANFFRTGTAGINFHALALHFHLAAANPFRSGAAGITAGITAAASANPCTRAGTTSAISGADTGRRRTGTFGAFWLESAGASVINAFRAATTHLAASHTDAVSTDPSSGAGNASTRAMGSRASNPAAATAARNAAAASHIAATQDTMAGIATITDDTTNASACAVGNAGSQTKTLAATGSGGGRISN